MNNTIKVIDLLNKIANGEVPIKVRYKSRIFKWNEDYQSYCAIGENYWFNIEYADLNNEVEIIEEEPEIDIQRIEKIRDYRTSEDDLYNDNFEDFRGTINELVEAIKQLDKQIKEK